MTTWLCFDDADKHITPSLHQMERQADGDMTGLMLCLVIHTNNTGDSSAPSFSFISPPHFLHYTLFFTACDVALSIALRSLLPNHAHTHTHTRRVRCL